MLMKRLGCVVGVLFSCIVLHAPANAQFGGLTSRIPRGANTIIIVNAERVHRSPLAQEQNWRAQHEKQHAAGLTILPATARHFVLASKMDFTFMQPIWEVAMADLSYKPTIPAIATRWGGSVDHVAGRSCALLPDDSYVVELGENRIGAMRPANRQSVSRWLKDTNRVDVSKDNLSNYLVQARTYADKNKTPIIMAMDLHDVISPAMVLQKAQEYPDGPLAQTSLDMEKVANAIAGLRGLTLGINIKDHVSGAIILDFSEDVEFMKDLAKPVLLSALDNHSAMIDEFSDWNVDASGKRIRIGGRLYQSGLRRILSVLDVPGSLQANMPSADNDDPEAAKRIATQAYFKSVTGLLDDLKEKPRDTKVKTSGQVGLWYGRYAKKIDNLPLLNVDQEMLDYGGFISASMRDAENALRNVGGRTRVRQLNAPAQYRGVGRWGSYGGYGGYYGGYAGAWVESPRLEAQDRARIATEERVKGADSARQVQQQIAAATADIRRRMTEKYQAEF